MNGSVQKELPSEAQSFNWGAFFLTWIWAIGNRSIDGVTAVLFVLCIVPFLGVASAITLAIYSGVTGSKRAWQKKNWTNLDHFQRVQRRWAVVGLAQFIFAVLFLMFVPFFYSK